MASQSPGPPVCHRPEGGGHALVSRGRGAGVRGGSTHPPPPPAHSHMTVMWIFRRLVPCFIRRRKGEHGGTWGKDASRGGVWVWTPLPSAPMAPMPESSTAGSLPAVHLLFDPRAFGFGTPHYQVLLQQWAQLGQVKQLRQGKVVVSGVDWATVLAVPRPIYDLGCQPWSRASYPTPAA